MQQMMLEISLTKKGSGLFKNHIHAKEVEHASEHLYGDKTLYGILIGMKSNMHTKDHDY